MSDEEKTRDQLIHELNVLRKQLDNSKVTETELKDRCDQLEAVAAERKAEQSLLELHLQRKQADCAQAEREIEGLRGEMEERVRQRTEELEKACEQMKKLDEMKDTFLSSVSHELRTPLTSIRSFSEILLNYEDVDGEHQKEFLEIINAESERLTRLINDVLDISKIEAGRIIWHDDLISLEQVIKETVKAQQAIIQDRSLSVILEISEEMPLVFADPDRLQQVVTNLLSNAVKFSQEGGRILIRAERLEERGGNDFSEWIEVRVEDQGIGIEGNDLETIFEKFRQSTTDTLTDKPNGTGLGLPICKEILAHYRGDIWVESEKGKGSSFFFTLPGAPLTSKDLEEMRPVDAPVAGWKGKTVLVVDDNRNVRRLLRFQLQTRGYTVLEASNGQQALDLAKGAHIDLITLDLMMPTMSGYDVLEMIREDPSTKEVPILVISVVEDKEMGILFGANDYLKKPFREKDLIEKIRTLLGEEKKSILVVDDEQAVAMSLRLQLEEKGFPVDIARNGDEAIESMKHHVPDLLILDVVMPQKNGYEVLNWVRKEETTSRLPVIILSACPMSADHGQLLSLGVDAFVEKTQGLASLFEQIDSMLLPPPS